MKRGSMSMATMLLMVVAIFMGKTSLSASDFTNYKSAAVNAKISSFSVDAGVTSVLFSENYVIVKENEAEKLQDSYEEIKPEIETEVDLDPEYEIRDVYEIANGNTTKTVLPYQSFGKRTNQERLQNLCETNEVGLRVYDDRYTVAVGSYFGMQIGQYFDLELANGVIIPCIMGDEKSDEHTDEQNLFTVSSGCMTEFIVERKYLPNRNSATYCYPDWKSRVVKVTVYDHVLDLNAVKE